MVEPYRDIHFRKDMGITRKEFLRTLSAVLEGCSYRLDLNKVIIADAGRHITISLSRQNERHLGALQLPRMCIDFTFSGYSRNEAEALMSEIEVHFQRGGG